MITLYRLLASLGVPIMQIETDDPHETVYRLCPEEGCVVWGHLRLQLCHDGTMRDDLGQSCPYRWSLIDPLWQPVRVWLWLAPSLMAIVVATAAWSLAVGPIIAAG